MAAIYADRNSIFFAADKHGEPVVTQFGRALEQLGIDLIPAGSPQAKGRVERFNGTAQGPPGQRAAPGGCKDDGPGQ